MNSILKILIILIFLALVAMVSEIPFQEFESHLFMVVLLSQVAFLVILSNLRGFRNRNERGSFIDATFIQSFSWFPIVICGGISNPQTIIFFVLPLMGAIIRGYQRKSFFGVCLIIGLDAFHLVEAQMNLVPEFESHYLFYSSLWEDFAKNGVLMLLIYFLSIYVKNPSTIHSTTSSIQSQKPNFANNPPKNQSTKSLSKKVQHSSTNTSSSGQNTDPMNPGSIQVTEEDIEKDQARLDGVLEEIVVFLAKMFKSLTATGFLSSDGGKTFTLNAVVSKKPKNIDYNSVAYIGSGMIGSSALKENGFMSGDLRSYPEKIEYYDEKPAINSLMAVRITNASGRIIGALSVDSETMRAFNDDDKDLMFRFSKVASMLVSNVKMSKELKENSRIQDLSYGLAKIMSEQLKPNDVIKTLMKNLNKMFQSHRQVFCHFDSASGQGRVHEVSGAPGKVKVGMSFGLSSSNSIYAKAFRSSKTQMHQQLSDTIYRFNQYHPEDKTIRVLTAPIVGDKSEIYGVIGIEYSESDIYKPSDELLLNTIALNAGSSITKAVIFQKMEKEATIDGLTQIPNHRNFQTLMDMEMGRALRDKSQVSLLLMDIDHFKKFNDTYGHPVGDLVLKMVAKALKSAVRKTDHIARYGGEEFVVILPQAEGELGRQLAERVRKAIEAINIPHESGVLKVTMSIGMCTYPKLVKDKAELIECADQALYYSKENGRNQVSLYEEIPKS